MASIISAGTTSGTALNMTADTSGQLQLATGASATTAVTIDASQNVGIGTTSSIASGKFTVAASSASVNQLVIADTQAYSAQPIPTLLFAGQTSTGTYNPLAYMVGGKTNATSGDTSGYMSFWTNNTSAGLNERMRIDSSGKLLVGSGTSPSGGSVTMLAASSIGGGIQLANTTANNGGLINATGGSGLLFYGYTGAIGSETYTERMRIDSSGNVLVGTTNSSATAGGGFKLIPDGTFGGNLLSVVGSATSNSFQGYYLYSTGAGAARFYVGYGGTIFATSTSITAISDESLKENVRDLDIGLNEVMALKPRRFDWKEETEIDEKNVAGFIAQEVESVLPELVYDYQYNDTETKKALKMGDMLPTLVKAIQELKEIVDAQATRIAALEAK